MQLIAREPLDMVAGCDRRPGDTFECDDEEAHALVDAGKADYADGDVKSKRHSKADRQVVKDEAAATAREAGKDK